MSGYNGGQGRFVLLATDGTNFALAASENASPENSATTWCTYLVNGVTTNADGSTDWVDYPALGMDGDYLYITSNQFSNGSNSFQYARLMILSKASVYPDATTGSCPRSRVGTRGICRIRAAGPPSASSPRPSRTRCPARVGRCIWSTPYGPAARTCPSDR